MNGISKIIRENQYSLKFIFTFTCLFIFLNGSSQLKNQSFSFFNTANNSQVAHTSVQPFLETFQIILKSDSSKRKTSLGKKWWEESMLNITEKDVHLTVDPLFNFSTGIKNKDEDYYSANVRGFRITGDISSKFSFETRFYENQFFYPKYLNKRAIERADHENTIDAIAFGIGRAKNFKENGLDASLANGYFSFSPLKNINFQLGHGRHFFGNGYRSLVLSDYAPDYPYLCGQYYLFDKKILYKHVTAWMSNLNRIPASSTAEALFVPKSANFNQVSFQPSNNFSIALFESAIYNNYNISDRVSPFTSFYIPVLGASLIDNDSTNTTNLIYGLNWNLQVFKNWMIYNQYSISSIDKIGFQIGIKNFNPFSLKNSFINIEFNTLPTGLYSVDSSNLFQKYSHLGHELAHPLGSGFQEILFKSQLSLRSVFLRMNYSYINFSGNNQSNGFANEVFTSLEEIELPNSENKSLIFLNTSIGLYFNPSTNMEISLGHLTRCFDSKIENYFLLSWRTYLKNDYFDQ